MEIDAWLARFQKRPPLQLFLTLLFKSQAKTLRLNICRPWVRYYLKPSSFIPRVNTLVLPSMPPKRTASTPQSSPASKRNSSNKAPKKSTSASAGAAARKSLQEVDTGDQNIKAEDRSETPFAQLSQCIEDNPPSQQRDGSTVVFWMRMKDLRISDNKGLAHAASIARDSGRHLVVLHCLSPNDFKAHKRSARRVDFVLRNLKSIKAALDQLHIPLHVMTVTPRKSVPAKVAAWSKSINASDVVANIEYEVDELRQLIHLYDQAKEHDFNLTCLHDHCIAKPGTILTKEGRPQTVYSPWFRKWCDLVAEDPSTYQEDYGRPSANPKSARSDLQALFEEKVPDYVEGYKLEEAEAEKMSKLWPHGEEAGQNALDKFFKSKSDAVGIAKYKENRNRPDLDGTSRLSPYIALLTIRSTAGVVSTRQVLRATLPLSKNKLDVDRLGTNIGNFNGEIAWRDFYSHVMCWWPRISMNGNFNKKYDAVVWEYDDDALQTWKDGKTGYPFVDAGMRQLAQEGWMHNRLRMCVAMFLTKDLMLDWRLGEAYFAEQLIDSDLSANNGGWQWSASTGTDPQPYFRVFNPTTQSEKCDPDGEYIRRYLPELRNVKGKAVHEPHSRLSKSEFEKLDYPKPMVDHAKARVRAIARFKEPGSDQGL